MTTRIIRGDARAGLRLLASDSVHCVKTSPPYYGLRSYECEEAVWGGDEGCNHSWGNAVVERAINHVRKARWQHSVNGRGEEQDKRVGGEAVAVPQEAFCSRCGAWRGTLGLEPDWRDYLSHLVEVFREVRRVLRDDGVIFLNMGDTYASGAGKVGEHPGGGERGERWAGRPANGETSWAGRGVPKGHRGRADRDGSHAGKHVAMAAMGPMTQPNRMPQFGFKPKDRMMMPARLAIALQEDGWFLRDEIIFSKPNPMPSSVEDRTTPAHEMVYVLTKNARYYWDGEAIKEPFAESSVPRMERAARREEPEPGGLRADLFDRTGAAVQNYRRPNEVLRDLSQRITRKPQGWDLAPGAHSTRRHTSTSSGSAKFAGHADGESSWEGAGRNRRSVWTIATEPFGGEFCGACRTYFEGDDLRALRVEEVKREDGRKERRRWCSCGVFDRWVSHFACFPTKLVEPCLLAACPERCCPGCGQGWRRVMGNRIPVQGRGSGNKERVLSEERGVPGSKGHVAASVPWSPMANEMAGWYPDCRCDGLPALPDYPSRDPEEGEEAWAAACGPVAAERARLVALAAPLRTVPGVALDPFGGSGTVGVVAERLQRDSIMIELSADYAEMARQRIAGKSPLFACVEVEETNKPAEVADADGDEDRAALLR